MKTREIDKKITAAGWVLVRVSGSHRQYKSLSGFGTATVPFHPGKDIPIGTVKSIERQTGLSLRR